LSKYPAVKDGAWIQPVRRGYKMACCDCSLVHVLDVRIVKGRVQIRVTRDTRATGQKRRHDRVRLRDVDE